MARKNNGLLKKIQTVRKIKGTSILDVMRIIN